MRSLSEILASRIAALKNSITQEARAEAEFRNDVAEAVGSVLTAAVQAGVPAMITALLQPPPTVITVDQSKKSST